MKTDQKWKELIAQAQARFEALTPEQQAAERQAQRESFARGMGPCEHGVYDFEDCPKCREKARG